MIAENEQLPEIEQLERHNFILDTEEHQRLQAEEDQLIQQVGEGEGGGGEGRGEGGERRGEKVLSSVYYLPFK